MPNGLGDVCALVEGWVCLECLGMCVPCGGVGVPRGLGDVCA